MALLSWHIVTQAEYDAGVKAKSIKENAMYFLSDTRKVMKQMAGGGAMKAMKAMRAMKKRR